MGDQILNGALLFLFMSVIVSIVFILESPIGLAEPVKRKPVSLPRDWVEIHGKWTCANVTPESLSDMLRVLRMVEKAPSLIRLEPPVAEVIW